MPEYLFESNGQKWFTRATFVRSTVNNLQIALPRRGSKTHFNSCDMKNRIFSAICDFATWFVEVDTNHDGKISRVELYEFLLRQVDSRLGKVRGQQA